MIEVDVRPCTAADLDALLAREPVEARRHHERARYETQERGDGLLLLAWSGDAIVGRTMFRDRTPTKEIVKAFGDVPEINALDAWPQGQGIGTQIIAACERIARDRGDALVGIGVELNNPNAQRLYERLGYEVWGRVLDEWGEYDSEGRVHTWHQDPCWFLLKHLAPSDL